MLSAINNEPFAKSKHRTIFSECTGVPGKGQMNSVQGPEHYSRDLQHGDGTDAILATMSAGPG